MLTFSQSRSQFVVAESKRLQSMDGGGGGEWSLVFHQLVSQFKPNYSYIINIMLSIHE